jgi:hypothetical protein
VEPDVLVVLVVSHGFCPLGTVIDRAISAV